MTEIKRHGLPSDNCGDISWFESLNDFEKQETCRQVKFKRNHWPGLADGVWSKHPTYSYPHILPAGNEEKVFFDASVLSYLKKGDITLHTEALNLRSSQVCCLNFLFHLKMNVELANLVLAPILPNVIRVKDIEFEYTGPYDVTDWLGEPAGGKRGQNRTSIDAAIFWNDKVGNKRITLIEWKYTERSFGSCGGYESDGNKNKNICRSLNAVDKSAEKECYLTIKGVTTNRKYWEHLEKAGIDKKKFIDVKGCPFRGPFYQLLRQSLLAAYLRDNRLNNIGNINKVEVVVLSFRGNRSLLAVPSYIKPLLKGNEKSILDAWNKVMPHAPSIQHLIVEEIMEAADKVLPAQDAWRNYIRERYGL